MDGLEFFPRRGPVLIAARHYHHLYDGAALIMLLPRRMHIFVALDWVRNKCERWAMEFACASARWPVALRPQRFSGGTSAPGAFGKSEIARYLRQSLADAVKLLREKRVLVVFPEGFPAVEADGSHTRGDDALLPFQGGFISIVARAQREGAGRVPIVPAGFAYTPIEGGRYRVHLRLGAPLYLDRGRSHQELANAVEARVRELSTR